MKTPDNFRSPYPGLRPFERHEDALFFGRDEQVDQLLDKLDATHFLAVLGTSGSGKSSAVFAGLVPLLREEGNWLIAGLRPGNQPFHALAAALLPALEPKLDETDRLVKARKLAEAHDGPTLVVTHHVPHSAACHPTHGLNELGPAFWSDCDDLIAAASLAGVKAWIFGLHHWSHAVEVSGVPLVSAQPGYPGENTAWISPGYFEL